VTPQTHQRFFPHAVPTLLPIALIVGTLWCDGAHAAATPRSRAKTVPAPAPPAASAAWDTGGPPPETTVYRCGSSYSPRPCAGAEPLAIADARSNAQRLQAEDVAARDKHLAAWLEEKRRERETLPEPAKKTSQAAARKCVASPTVTCPEKKPKTLSKAAAKALSEAAAANTAAAVVTPSAGLSTAKSR
jgi:hypothetical protein